MCDYNCPKCTLDDCTVSLSEAIAARELIFKQARESRTCDFRCDRCTYDDCIHEDDQDAIYEGWQKIFDDERRHRQGLKWELTRRLTTAEVLDVVDKLRDGKPITEYEQNEITLYTYEYDKEITLWKMTDFKKKYDGIRKGYVFSEIPGDDGVVRMDRMGITLWGNPKGHTQEEVEEICTSLLEGVKACEKYNGGQEEAVIDFQRKSQLTAVQFAGS